MIDIRKPPSILLLKEINTANNTELDTLNFRLITDAPRAVCNVSHNTYLGDVDVTYNKVDLSELFSLQDIQIPRDAISPDGSEIIDTAVFNYVSARYNLYISDSDYNLDIVDNELYLVPSSNNVAYTNRLRLNVIPPLQTTTPLESWRELPLPHWGGQIHSYSVQYDPTDAYIRYKGAEYIVANTTDNLTIFKYGDRGQMLGEYIPRFTPPPSFPGFNAYDNRYSIRLFNNTLTDTLLMVIYDHRDYKIVKRSAVYIIDLIRNSTIFLAEVNGVITHADYDGSKIWYYLRDEVKHESNYLNIDGTTGTVDRGAPLKFCYRIRTGWLGNYSDEFGRQLIARYDESFKVVEIYRPKDNIDIDYESNIIVHKNVILCQTLVAGEETPVIMRINFITSDIDYYTLPKVLARYQYSGDYSQIGVISTEGNRGYLILS